MGVTWVLCFSVALLCYALAVDCTLGWCECWLGFVLVFSSAGLAGCFRMLLCSGFRFGCSVGFGCLVVAATGWVLLFCVCGLYCLRFWGLVFVKAWFWLVGCCLDSCVGSA